jgi:Holliday junction resolvase RusA-like endonuclease
MTITTAADTRQRTTIRVEGLPRPKGSLRAVGRKGEKARLIEQVDPKGTWRTAVKNAVIKTLPDDHEAWLCPVELKLTFRFPRPQRPRHDWPTTRSSGDLDKLQRNIYDALQTGSGAGLIKDDSQIVCVTALKQYARTEDEVGVTIEVIEYEGHGNVIPGATRKCAICGTPSGEYAECTRCVLDHDNYLDSLDND